MYDKLITLKSFTDSSSSNLKFKPLLCDIPTTVMTVNQ